MNSFCSQELLLQSDGTGIQFHPCLHSFSLARVAKSRQTQYTLFLHFIQSLQDCKLQFFCEEALCPLKEISSKIIAMLKVYKKTFGKFSTVHKVLCQLFHWKDESLARIVEKADQISRY